MKALHTLAVLLIVVGALNWGLVALARFDLVAFIFGLRFGETSWLSRIVYALVGLAAVFRIYTAVAPRHRGHPQPAAA